MFGHLGARMKTSLRSRGVISLQRRTQLLGANEHLPRPVMAFNGWYGSVLSIIDDAVNEELSSSIDNCF